MLKLGGALLIALIVTTAALAQGFGIGVGLDDLRRNGIVSVAPPPTPCATSLVLDQTVACNAIAVPLLGL